MTVVQLKVARKKRAAAKPAEPPKGMSLKELFEFEMGGVLRLTADSGAANGSSEDPVVLSGESERAMRAMIGEFCLPRLPLTIAEFYTVVEYCQMLDSAAGFSTLRELPEMLESWQSVSIPKYQGFHPEHAQAIELYCTGKKDELRALHAREKTIEALAKTYGEFDNEPEPTELD